MPCTIIIELLRFQRNITKLHVWYSKLGFRDTETVLFKELNPIQVGIISFQLWTAIVSLVWCLPFVVVLHVHFVVVDFKNIMHK